MLTLCLPVSSTDNVGKQFGPRLGPMNRQKKSAEDKKKTTEKLPSIQ